MSSRLYAWRKWAAHGGHLLEQRFETPEQAGLWRRETFPATEGPERAPLTLAAVVNGEQESVTNYELFLAHDAWLFPVEAKT